MSGRKKQKGFTIVELLIVIVVIGILAAIVIVAFNGVSQRAKASSIADGFKKFEKAMTLFVTSGNYSAWPVDNDASLTGSGNPTLPSLINNAAGFKNYMQSAPSVDGVPTTSWRYDFDQDTYNGGTCGSASPGSGGVNIYIDGFADQDMARLVDEIIDNGDITCGKLRMTATPSLVYSLSPNGSM